MSCEKYHKQAYDYVNSMGATEHQLTTGTNIRAELDARGEYNAEVYNWHVAQLPEDKIKSMDRVEELVLKLHTAAQALYKRKEMETTEESVRRALVEVAEFEDFSKTHPRLFWLMSARTVKPEHRMHVLNLISIKRDHQHKKLGLKQQQQQISAYMHANFVREAAPGEEEQAIRDGTGLHGEVVSTIK